MNICGGLNDNGPHRHICLITWFPVGGPVWERLGDVALLKECPFETLKFQKPTPPHTCDPPTDGSQTFGTGGKCDGPRT